LKFTSNRRFGQGFHRFHPEVFAKKLIGSSLHHFLVGGIPTPLKNMSSSVGIMKFQIYGKVKFMFQTTNQVIKVLATCRVVPLSNNYFLTLVIGLSYGYPMTKLVLVTKTCVGETIKRQSIPFKKLLKAGWWF
jgi:uncharacterized metal-binding protein